MTPRLVTQKAWSPEIHWSLYMDHPLPERELCAAAFCVVVEDGRIALTRHHRGWDIPGGHIEPGESVEAAARRETYEETGLIVEDLRLIAVQRSDQTVPQSRDGRPYPFPSSYGCWYLARATERRPIPAGSESSEMAFFTPEEIRAMGLDFAPLIDELTLAATV